jgi:16S rRNA (adenine1518-N6/adenine1519-N6)-dimethyltransferase
MVRPKKFLGQHFLKDRNIARKIVDALDVTPGYQVIEIGPGTGMLTELLAAKEIQLRLVEIDTESVDYLHEHFPLLKGKIIHGDFLELDVTSLADGSFAIIGNFPYNISSQIFFRVIDMRQQVTQVVCMLQKEVAKRLVASKGNKTYGILSVLLQAYYDMKYLFDVSPGVFHPPPKVTSGVIRLTRNARTHLGCDEELFTRLVKQGFQNRRKTLRNALKNLNLPATVYASDVMDQRAEQLSVEEFITLARQVQKESEGADTI